MVITPGIYELTSNRKYSLRVTQENGRWYYQWLTYRNAPPSFNFEKKYPFSGYGYALSGYEKVRDLTPDDPDIETDY